MSITEYLREQGVEFELRRHEQAYTAQEEAQAQHVSGSLFAKTVIVKAGEEYVMLVLPASQHADLEQAGALLGQTVVLAREKEQGELFPDCELGAEPPFGSLYQVRTLVDESLGRHERIAFRAGNHTEVILMAYRDYERLEQAQVGRFAEPAE
jgi:Ala-tRNA(Pro) deacylase